MSSVAQQERLDEGSDLVQRGDYERAWRIFSDCLETHGADAGSLAGMGVCALHLGRPNEAFAFLQRAHGLVPGNAHVVLAWAQAARRLGRLNELEEILARAIEANPDDMDLQIIQCDCFAVDQPARTSPLPNREEAVAGTVGPTSPVTDRRQRMSESELARRFSDEMGWGAFRENKLGRATFEFLLRASTECDEREIVLDVSAGECRYRPFFEHTRYLAVDSCVGSADWDFSNLDLIGDAASLPVHDESVDVCLNFTSLEHYPDPDRAFAEFSRVLRPGGRLFLYVPCCISEHQAPHDYYRYTRYALARFCERNGLEIRSLRPSNGLYYTAFNVLGQAVASVDDDTIRQRLEELRQQMAPILAELEEDDGVAVDYPHGGRVAQWPAAYCLSAVKPGNTPRDEHRPDRDELLRSVVACPSCRHRPSWGEGGLYCERCARIYPFRDGIPELTTDAAVSGAGDQAGGKAPRSGLVLPAAEGGRAASLSQREFWREESYRYFHRNYHERDLRGLAPNVNLKRLIDQEALDGCRSVLELGCGPANNLHFLAQRLGAARGVGVEAGDRTVAALSGAFPEYEFVASDCVQLPFDDGEFDVVLLRSFLHWVDRSVLLQTLGEALRVTSRHLIVSDFAPVAPYSTPYHHRPDYRTFKISYRPLLEAGGLVRPVAGFVSHADDPWRSCETTLYRKLSVDEVFPLRSESEIRDSVGRTAGTGRNADPDPVAE